MVTFKANNPLLSYFKLISKACALFFERCYFFGQAFYSSIVFFDGGFCDLSFDICFLSFENESFNSLLILELILIVSLFIFVILADKVIEIDFFILQCQL